MRHHCLLIGREGAGAGRALAFAAMCGLLTVPGGQPLEEMKLTLVHNAGAEENADALKEAVSLLNRLHGFFPMASDAFFTKVTLECIRIDAPIDDPETAVLLSGDAAESAGFRIWLGRQDPTGPLASSLKEAGKDQLTVICPSAGGFGTAAFGLLPGWLKQVGLEAETDGILLLPSVRGTMQDNDRHLAQTAEVLKNGCSGYDHLCLIGLPESAMRDKGSTGLTELLAAVQVMRILNGTAADGMALLGSAADSFGWESFGPDGEALRVGIGRMLKAGILFETSLEGLVQEKLAAAWHLKDLRLGAALGGFRSLTDEQRTAAARELTDVMKSFRLFRIWINEILDTLPAQFRDAAGQRQSQRHSAENYRALLETAGRLGLMEDEIARTGMARESVVHRDQSAGESAADELLRKAEERREELKGLEGKQQALDQKTGGLNRFNLMQQMLRGIQRAEEAENRKTEEMRLRAEQMAPGAERDNLKEQIYRLEVHLRMLAKERERVLEDIREGERNGLRLIPPTVSSQASRSTDLFDEELLRQLEELLTMPELELKQKERLSRQIENMITALVLPAGTDPVDLKQLMYRVGQTIGDLKDGSAVGRFVACVIACCLDEAELPSGGEAGFCFLPDLKPMTDWRKLDSPEQTAEAMMLRPGAVWQDGKPSVTARTAAMLRQGEGLLYWRGLLAAVLLCEERNGWHLTARELKSASAEAAFRGSVRVLVASLQGKSMLLGVIDENILTPVLPEGSLAPYLPELANWYDRENGCFTEVLPKLDDGERLLLLERLKNLMQAEPRCGDLLNAWMEELSIPHRPPEREDWEACVTAILGFDREWFDLRVKLRESRLMGGTLLKAFGADIGTPAEDIPVWKLNGVPLAAGNASNGWGLELMPGCEELPELIRRETMLLLDGSSRWPAVTAKKIREWAEEQDGLCAEAREAAETLAARMEEAAATEKLTRISCPVDPHSSAVRALIHEALGPMAGALAPDPFSDLLTVMPGCGEKVLTDRVVAAACHVSFEEDAAWCPVLPPVSEELILAAQQCGLAIRPQAMRFTHMELDGEDIIRAELPLMGEKPLMLVRDYTPDELLILEPEEIPTAAVWPCVRFQDDRWRSYHLYLGSRGGFECRACAGGEAIALENVIDGFSLGSCEAFPEWLMLTYEGRQAGALPNQLPVFERRDDGEAVIAVSCSADGTAAMLRMNGELIPADATGLVRLLLDGGNAAVGDEFIAPGAFRDGFGSAVRMVGKGTRPLVDGCIAGRIVSPDETLCGILWSTEEGHEEAAAVHMGQVMLCAAATAVMNGAGQAAWYFTLPDGMAEEGRRFWQGLTSRLVRETAQVTGLETVRGSVCHVQEGLALGTLVKRETTGGFLTMTVSADTASLQLWLQGQNRPTESGVVPMGVSAMLLDTLMMNPSLLEEDLKRFMEAVPEQVTRLTEAFRSARHSAHDRYLSRGLLDEVLRDQRSVIASPAFIGGTMTGSLLLVQHCFLMALCGLMQEKVWEDSILRDYLDPEMPLFLAGRGALLLRAMPAELQTAVLQFIHAMMDGRNSVRRNPVSCGRPGAEAAMGLAWMRDPARETAVVGKRNFSGRVAASPEELMSSFLLGFRAVFPESAERLFPGMFDEAGRITVWAARMIANVTGSHFSGDGRVDPEALAGCLTEIRRVYW